MERISFQVILVLFLLSSLLTACDEPIPDDIKIDVLEIQGYVITLDKIKSAFSTNALIPPLYEQPIGTHLYALVIPIDIMTLPKNVSYNWVQVRVLTWKEIRPGAFDDKSDDSKVITAIPFSVDRNADKETSLKLASSLTYVVKSLTSGLTVDYSTNEKYQKLYRTVTAHLTPEHDLIWEFIPFKDEPIQSGTYFVVAVVEVQDGTEGNVVHVSATCSFSVSKAYGLSKEDARCISGPSQLVAILTK